ncbi:hypothetical protein A2U01_0036904, partial [Trifolium medium]|nr:hypothetical protein [Trifolium medium]
GVVSAHTRRIKSVGVEGERAAVSDGSRVFVGAVIARNQGMSIV